MEMIKKYSFYYLSLLMMFLAFTYGGIEVCAAESITINNELLTYDKIHYVDVNKGSDITGDGTINNAYQTLSKSLSMVQDGEAIVLADGEYEIDSLTSLVLDKEYSLIGQQKDTTVYLSRGNFNSYIKSTKKANIINMIFKPSSNFGSSNEQYVYWNNGSVPNIDFYNCVFVKNGSYPRLCFINWGNNLDGRSIDKKSNFYNCIIESGLRSAEFELDRLGGNVKFVNCATLNNDFMHNEDNFISSIKNIEVNSNYNITSGDWRNVGTGFNPDGSQANIGVYGGEFAWSYVISSPTNLTAAPSNDCVILYWDKVNAESYTIVKYTTGSAKTVIATNITDTTYIDKDVEPGVTYYYIVRAVMNDLVSEDSNIASAMIEKSNNRAIVLIKMLDENDKEYDLSMDVVDTFVNWYHNRGAGEGTAYYVFEKGYNVGPYVSRKDYIAFDKIICFEVNEYIAE